MKCITRQNAVSRHNGPGLRLHSPRSNKTQNLLSPRFGILPISQKKSTTSMVLRTMMPRAPMRKHKFHTYKLVVGPRVNSPNIQTISAVLREQVHGHWIVGRNRLGLRVRSELLAKTSGLRVHRCGEHHHVLLFGRFDEDLSPVFPHIQLVQALVTFMEHQLRQLIKLQILVPQARPGVPIKTYGLLSLSMSRSFAMGTPQYTAPVPTHTYRPASSSPRSISINLPTMRAVLRGEVHRKLLVGRNRLG